MKEERPMEGTSKTKTHVEKLLYATMLELEKAKVDAIKWKRVEEDNKGKMKEEVAQELEQQLQLMQEKFQIMTMQKVDYSQKLKVENQKLQQQLSKVKRDLHEKSEQVEIMQETVKTIAKVSEEMLECRPPARTYTLFLKEQWHKNQITHLAKFVKFNLDTPKYFLDAYQGCNMEEKSKLCEFYLHNLVLPHPYNWNPNPYVGDVQLMAFSSWLRHEEMRARRIQKVQGRRTTNTPLD
jgi:hypothetical protein